MLSKHQSGEGAFKEGGGIGEMLVILAEKGWISSGEATHSRRDRLQGKLLMWSASLILKQVSLRRIRAAPVTQCWEDSGLQLNTHNIQWHSFRAMRTWKNHPPPTVLLGVPEVPTQTHTPLHINCHAVCCFIGIPVAPPAAFYWFCGSKSHQGLTMGWRQGTPWVEVKNSGQGVETCFRWIEIKRMILNDTFF